MKPLAFALLASFGLMLTLQAEPEVQVYKTIGEDTELTIQIFKPADWSKDDKRPAIVFYHGGGWRGGTPKQFEQHSEHLAKRGMVAFGVQYRLKNTHDSTPLDSTMDARSAFRWVRAHADEFGIDPNRIAAGGGSAGGHLAAALATIELDDPQDDLSVSPMPNALLLFNPALDLDLPGAKENWGYLGMDKIMSISPHQHLKKGFPPTLIFHGTGDTTVPYHTAEDFAKKAVSLGADVRLRGYDGRPHGFFNVSKGGGADFRSTLAESDDFLVELGWLKPQES